MTAFKRAPRRTPVRRLAAVAAVSAAALLLSACGGDDMDDMDHADTGASADESTGAGRNEGADGFNDTDVAFAQMMIPYHEQALDMARLADGRASDTEIKKIAAAVEKAQDPEIRTMKGWLSAWKQPTAVASMPGMDHDGAGMMTDADMKELEAMKGVAFDKMFAEMMIEHHEGAIEMAEDERKNGGNAGARKLAGEVVTAQTAEVEQLEEILDRL
jgi:uncharacterized protein (DUF305 family)